MGDGPPGFRRNFSCSAVLRIHIGVTTLFITGLLPSVADLSRSLHLRSLFVTPMECPTTPKGKPFGLGCFRFARRYSGNRFCFLFLRVLRCFSSPGLPAYTLWIQVWLPSHYGWWVPPFGNLRINAYLQLPEAYRCSSRPSSAPSAKVSTVRPFLLNHFLCSHRLSLASF